MVYPPDTDEKNKRAVLDATGTVSELQSDKYLVFMLANQEYAMEVEMVKEVIHYSDVTEVPNAYSYVRGVLSLRGAVIPVIDFMKYSGLSSASEAVSTRILIVYFNDMLIGILADSIVGVVAIPSGRLRPVPEFIGRENLRFYKGAIEYDNKFVLLIEPGMERL